MRILDCIQGTPEWEEICSDPKYHRASLAAAMLGQDKKKPRDKMLRMSVLGTREEFSSWVQENLLDKGHGIEAVARESTEERISEDLYPIVATDDDGYLLASFDGVTESAISALKNRGRKIGFECKMWNEDLLAYILEQNDLPPSHWPQVEQQIAIAELDYVIFVISDGESKEFTFEYKPVPGRIEQIRRGWKLFDEDRARMVENGVPTEGEHIPNKADMPGAVLPAISIRIDGALTKHSNLDAFGVRLDAYIKLLPAAPSTDDEFALCDKACGELKTAEERLDAAESNAFASIESVEELRRQVGNLRNLARETRLRLEKLVKQRKEQVKADACLDGSGRLTAHERKLNARLGQDLMPKTKWDFAAVTRSKRTLQTYKDAVDHEVVRLQLEMDRVCEGIEANLAILRDAPPFPDALLPDLKELVLKPADDFRRAIEERVRKAQEVAATVAPPATSTPIVTVESVLAVTGAARSAAGTRPSDSDIIITLANHYKVSAAEVTNWLRTMNLRKAA